MYGKKLEDFIKSYINHITKMEFFITFHAAYITIITP